MKLYSQRDDRWKLKKLGFSNVSIGNFGLGSFLGVVISPHKIRKPLIPALFRTKPVFVCPSFFSIKQKDFTTRLTSSFSALITIMVVIVRSTKSLSTNSTNWFCKFVFYFKRMMFAFSSRKELKVINSIVKFIVVYMMNTLRRLKSSFKIFFHNISVFIYSFSIRPNNPISMRRYIPFCSFTEFSRHIYYNNTSTYLLIV